MAAKKKKMGRPSKPIDIEQLEQLAAIHCTQKEAAGFLGVSIDTFKRRLKSEKYRTAWEDGLQKGKASLRRTQFRLAERSAAMAIFLGKQYLDQKDEQKIEHAAPGGGVIPFTIDLSDAQNGFTVEDSDVEDD